MPPKPPSVAPLPVVDPSTFDKFAVFDRIGYKPDAWQDLFHRSTARHRILACGVRVGKTFALAPEAVAATICPSKKSVEAGEWVGSRVWLVAPTYDIVDKLFLLTARYIRRHFPRFVTGYSERDRLLKTIAGGYLQGKSADNSDSLVSEELDALIVDEAPRVGEQEKENARQRLITRGGWGAYIGSPVPNRWFQRDFALGQGAGYSYEWVGEPVDKARFAGRKVRFVPGVGESHPEYFSITVPTHANERIDASELLDLERMPDRIYRADVLAEFMSSEGQVFGNFERLATAPRLLNGAPGRRYVVAWDVGRAKDYSVLTALDYQSREQVLMDRFRGPWDYQYDRVEQFCRRFARPDLIVDATGKGDAPTAEMVKRNNQAAAASIRDVSGLAENDPLRIAAKKGPFAARVEPIEIVSNSIKRDLVETLAMAFDQGLIQILPDPVLHQELRLFEYKQSDATGVVRYGAPPGFHDDTVMSLAMAWWRCSRPRGTSAFVMG